MSKTIKKSTSLLLAVVMILAMIPMMTAFAAADWETHKDDASMLANYMDEPLYTAIVNKYNVGGAGIGNDPTLVQAQAWTGGINLASENITGTLKGLDKFEKVTGINLGNNKFTGTIPDLTGVASITSFWVENNQLTGSIPDLSNNTALTTLRFNGNQLTGPIPDLSANTALVTLSAQNNKLTGSVPDMSTNTALVNLNLSNNSLTGTIPSFVNNTSLAVFALNINNLTGEIPDLSTNTALTLVNLANNRLTGTIPSFVNNTSLVTFVLNENCLTGEIPDLSASTDLTLVNLANNRLTGTIPSFSANTLLTQLWMEENCLTGTIPDLSALTVLTTVRFSGNYLTGAFPNVPASIVSIAVQNNMLEGAIPDLSACPNLAHVNAHFNKFTGALPSFSANTALVDLNVNTNQLSGPIPDFSANTNLTSLRLYGNSGLTGTIPAGLVLDGASIWGTEINASDRPINISSSVYKTSTFIPQDGIEMIMNWDVNNDGVPELNLALTTLATGVPMMNIDVNGDGKADINLDVNGDGLVDFNQANLLSDGITGKPIGWLPINLKVNPKYRASTNMFKIGPAPYYIVPADGQPSDLIIPNVKNVLVPGSNPEEYIDAGLTSVNSPYTLVSSDNENIDIDGDGIPDFNIVGNRKPAVLTGTDINGFPEVDDKNTTPENIIQSTDPNGLNFIAPGGKVPEDMFNIDINGDGTADYNILPNPTTLTEFDAKGQYTGTGTIDDEVVIREGTDGYKIYTPAEFEALSKKVIFDFKLSPIQPSSTPVFSPFGVILDPSATAIEPGKAYNIKVSLDDLINHVWNGELPIKFDNEAIEITGIGFDAASKATYGLIPLYVTGNVPSVAGYQIGEGMDLDMINRDGKFLLTFDTDTNTPITFVPGTPVPMFDITFVVKTAEELLGKNIEDAGFAEANDLFDGDPQLIRPRYVYRDTKYGSSETEYLMLDFSLQPKIVNNNIEIVSPEDGKEMPRNTQQTVTAEWSEHTQQDFIDDGVDWTVLRTDDNTDKTAMLDTTPTDKLKPVFKPTEPGTYEITVASKKDPTKKDTITIIVTDTVILTGRAQLSGKVRGTSAIRPTEVDKNIKVEVIEKSTGLTIGTPVFTTGTVAPASNFTITLPEDASKDISKYFIRLTRIGQEIADGKEDLGIRAESYLCAEVKIDLTGSTNSNVTLATPIHLVAGAFDAPNATKAKISPTDINVIKSVVGFKADEQSKSFDIDERNGIDGADMSTSRSFIDFKKDAYTIRYVGAAWTLVDVN